MAAKIIEDKDVETTEISTVQPISPMIVDLLKEFKTTARTFNGANPSARQIRRTLATLKDIINDLYMELDK